MRWERSLCAALALVLAGSAMAETVVATRTLRAGTVILASDLRVITDTIPGTLDRPEAVTGLEARTNIYAGRPIRPGEIGPPAIVERNQLITLIFSRSGLTISVEGRALERGGVGDRVRAMNLASRSTVIGEIKPSGVLEVASR